MKDWFPNMQGYLLWIIYRKLFVPEDKLKMLFKLKASKQTKEQGKGGNAGNSEGS